MQIIQDDVLKVILFAKKTLHFSTGRAFLSNSSNLTGRWHSRNTFICSNGSFVSKVAAIQTFRSLVNENINLIDFNKLTKRSKCLKR